MTALSEFVCGRKSNRKAFDIAQKKNGCFVVTSFTTYYGKRMYADATYIGKRKNYPGTDKHRKGQHRYRVIVTPKQKEPDMASKHDKKPLEPWMMDSAGKKAPVDLVNKHFFHPKTGGMYIAIGCVWDSERERWMIMYRKWDMKVGAPEGQVFVHLEEDFTREGRFLPVNM